MATDEQIAEDHRLEAQQTAILRKGFRPPPITTVQRDAIPNPFPTTIIKNTDTGRDEMFNGTEWVPVPEPKAERPRSKKRLGER